MGQVGGLPVPSATWGWGARSLSLVKTSLDGGGVARLDMGKLGATGPQAEAVAGSGVSRVPVALGGGDHPDLHPGDFHTLTPSHRVHTHRLMARPPPPLALGSLCKGWLHLSPPQDSWPGRPQISEQFSRVGPPDSESWTNLPVCVAEAHAQPPHG